jgi:hypothetical protein
MSVWVFTHCWVPPKPPHIIAGAGHPHWPEVHVPAGPQSFPQAPQFAISVAVSTQVTLLFVPHFTWLLAQTQTPELHVPSPQLCVQVPQWLGSLVVS